MCLTNEWNDIYNFMDLKYSQKKNNKRLTLRYYVYQWLHYEIFTVIITFLNQKLFTYTGQYYRNTSLYDGSLCYIFTPTIAFNLTHFFVLRWSKLANSIAMSRSHSEVEGNANRDTRVQITKTMTASLNTNMVTMTATSLCCQWHTTTTTVTILYHGAIFYWFICIF